MTPGPVQLPSVQNLDEFLYGYVDFTTEGENQEIGSLPANAYVIDVLMERTASFNDSTSNLLELEVIPNVESPVAQPLAKADPDEDAGAYTAVNVKGVDGTPFGAAHHQLVPAGGTVLVAYTGGTHDATTGECIVIVKYIPLLPHP